MRFIIYGKEDCQYCENAKNLLSEKGYEFTYSELGKDYTKEELLELAPSAKTYPQIWVDSGMITEYVGGFTELEYLFKVEVIEFIESFIAVMESDQVVEVCWEVDGEIKTSTLHLENENNIGEDSIMLRDMVEDKNVTIKFDDILSFYVMDEN